MGSPGLVDSPTDLHHQRLVLLYAGLGPRDGLGLYMEHWLGVGLGIQRSGSEMPLGVLRKPVQRL